MSSAPLSRCRGHAYNLVDMTLFFSGFVDGLASRLDGLLGFLRGEIGNHLGVRDLLQDNIELIFLDLAFRVEFSSFLSRFALREGGVNLVSNDDASFWHD